MVFNRIIASLMTSRVESDESTHLELSTQGQGRNALGQEAPPFDMTSTMQRASMLQDEGEILSVAIRKSNSDGLRCFHQKDFIGAERHYLKAVQAAHGKTLSSDSQQLMASVYANLSHVRMLQGRCVQALRDFDTALVVFRCSNPDIVANRTTVLHKWCMDSINKGNLRPTLPQEIRRYLDDVFDQACGLLIGGDIEMSLTLFSGGLMLARDVFKLHMVVLDNVGRFHLMCGFCYVQVPGMESFAYKSANEALSCLGLNHFPVRILATLASFRLGRFVEAKRHIEKAIQMEPENEDAVNTRREVLEEMIYKDLEESTRISEVQEDGETGSEDGRGDGDHQPRGRESRDVRPKFTTRKQAKKKKVPTATLR